MTIDPKTGTTHTTALTITGEVIITFEPNAYAPEEVKSKAVESTYAFSLGSANWQYNEEDIVTLKHTGAHDITWDPQDDGSFIFTISADDLADHITLTEFTLDTKAEYDAYNQILGQGSIVLTVSDGVTTSTPTTE